MTNGQASVGSDGDPNDDGTVFPLLFRERVTKRRRRARQNRREGAHWVAGRSRRLTVRTFAVCAGALLLMAIGLYFGLSRQESRAPLEGAAPPGSVGAASIV